MMQANNQPAANPTNRIRNPKGGPTHQARAANWDWRNRDFRRVIGGIRLIRRLQNHALGKLEMSNSAVRAAIALLDRVVPTLQAIEVKSETTHRFVLEVPSRALSSVDWERIDPELTQPSSSGPQTIEHSGT